MKDKIVYLGGPITGKSWEEASAWRYHVRDLLKIHNINSRSPLRGKEYLSKEKKIMDHYLDHVTSTAKAIFTRDRWDVINSDIVLMNFLEATQVSIGSVMEMVWAHENDIPIIVITDKNDIHKHGMLDEMVYAKIESIDEAVDIILILLL